MSDITLLSFNFILSYDNNCKINKFVTIQKLPFWVFKCLRKYTKVQAFSRYSCDADLFYDIIIVTLSNSKLVNLKIKRKYIMMDP